MNAFSKIDMGEVTRLTQAGKLAEAMALLQGHAASRLARGAPSEVRPSTQGIKRPSSLLPTIEMVAPSAPGAPGRLPLNSSSGLPGSPYGPTRPRGRRTLRR